MTPAGLLTDKILLVTGAGRGIGKAIVDAALREGAQVIAHLGRHPSDAMKAATAKLHVLHGDLSSPAGVEAIWKNHGT